MQDIREIKFPSKKGTLEFFKGFRLNKDAMSSSDVSFDINLDNDRFALTPEAAFQMLIDNEGISAIEPILRKLSDDWKSMVDKFTESIHNTLMGNKTESTSPDEKMNSRFCDWVFVVVKISIHRDELTGKSLVSDPDGTEYDCAFNKTDGYISLTLRDRKFKTSIENYDIVKMDIAQEKGTDRFIIKKLKLCPIVLAPVE